MVLIGPACPAWMMTGCRRVAEAMPYGRHTVVPDAGHLPPPDLLARHLIGFFTESTG